MKWLVGDRYLKRLGSRPCDRVRSGSKPSTAVDIRRMSRGRSGGGSARRSVSGGSHFTFFSRFAFPPSHYYRWLLHSVATYRFLLFSKIVFTTTRLDYIKSRHIYSLLLKDIINLVVNKSDYIIVL